MSRPSANVAEAILSGGQDDAPAIWYGREVVTHGALRAAVCALGARLLDAGCAKGERVGIWSENSPFFVAAYLGVIRAGLCAVPFPVDFAESTMERLVASTGMKRVLVSSRLGAKIEAMAGRLGVEVTAESHDEFQQALDDWAPAQVDPSRDLAAIVWTSGSTGEPKGVMVTHENIRCNTEDILSYLGIGPSDRIMVVLPFYYCFGTSLLHTHLWAGGSLVLNNRFMFPEKVLDEIVEKECTGLAGVPSTYQILLRKTRFAQRKFPSLCRLQQAGGKLPNPFIREIRRAFPEVALFVMYGQTEATARLSYLPPEMLDQKLGSIGKGLPHSRLEVLGPDGTPVRPGSDEVGEIVASGENVTLGYWDDPEETRQVFRDGRLLTGDLARVDQDGYLYIVERARDFIKAMGNRVSPKEIEEVLSEMPEVVEAAVIGVPDEIWGEAIKAFLVAAKAGALTAGDVRNHCVKRLPNHKIPSQIEFLARLPKTSNGKVAKDELRKMTVLGDPADVCR
jgi:acyl-CoA synthetase (AMP-forming)/AMP-acid ligase II